MSLLQDLRFALRLLVKDRWFSAVAIGALALGIGVNATVFTLVNAVLIRGLPFPEADRLFVLGVKPPTSTRGGETISYPDLVEWRSALTSYESLAAFARGGMTVSDARTTPESTPG